MVVQCIREPVTAEDASLGECLATGGHLSLHVPSLPHPLRGASSSKTSSFYCSIVIQWSDDMQNGKRVFIIPESFLSAVYPLMKLS